MKIKLTKTFLPVLLLFVVVAVSMAASPSPTATPTPSGNLSSFVAPSATPTPTPIVNNCTVAITDDTIGVANVSTTGIVAVQASSLHVFTVTLQSAFANGNSVTVNGSSPSGWTDLANGASITKTVDVTGLWTFVVTTAGCAPNSVSILAY